ncbi:hypothetical protein [Burkholderia sp. Ac-20353]|uniref:hypothetical protein n=1 Tax=Burkholderia sp. Ac-20353 TaxID=2703894 RepID=UPI00197C8EAC|nr:hypothetical protein [Burkholderia sp. Ac-20353]MBN3792484.1 hypothetical protein [Burkholderia sp. Ac-20353]
MKLSPVSNIDERWRLGAGAGAVQSGGRGTVGHAIETLFPRRRPTNSQQKWQICR